MERFGEDPGDNAAPPNTHDLVQWQTVMSMLSSDSSVIATLELLSGFLSCYWMIHLESVEMTVTSKLNYMTSSISLRIFRSEPLQGLNVVGYSTRVCWCGLLYRNGVFQSMTLLWAFYSACYSVKLFHLFSVILAESSFFVSEGEGEQLRRGVMKLPKCSCIPDSNSSVLFIIVRL